MIKAVLFDVDGVLLDSFEANLKFFQNLMIKTGYEPPTREEYAKNYFHLPMYHLIKTITKSQSEEELNRIWNMGATREVPYDLSLLKVPAGLEEVIKTLDRRFSVGIVTSRQRRSIFEAPALAKLEKFFKIVVSYEDTLNHKPNPDPLLFAATKLGIRPEECIYVGDAESDLIAAKAAGMRIIIYSVVALPEADACTHSFMDLPNLIDKMYQ